MGHKANRANESNLLAKPNKKAKTDRLSEIFSKFAHVLCHVIYAHLHINIKNLLYGAAKHAPHDGEHHKGTKNKR